MSHPPLRCLSIDVEDYFHIEAAYRTIPKTAWDDQPPRVERNTAALLDLFYRHNRKGTFFVLGYVAQRFPDLVRKIAQAGHEVASHGHMHDRLHRLDSNSFREDLTASKKLLEDITGQSVIGYRAPTFSVVRQTSWAIDVLIDAGFEYDASIFPVRHHWYGVPDAPIEPFHVAGESGRTLLEIPPLTWRVFGKNLPVAGGGYFRLLPPIFMRRGLRQAEQQQRPAVLYFHPWEFDPDMPRMDLPLTGRIRTYTGLKSATARLERLMQQPARWTTIQQSLDAFRQLADQSPRFALTPL
jgi:polysaccharide deacetylase family protein (PEP-CTERM system associated)